MYDESNYITHTFYTELNKKLQIYGIIPTSTIGIESTTKLVRPENGLKFNVINENIWTILYFKRKILQNQER